MKDIKGCIICPDKEGNSPGTMSGKFGRRSLPGVRVVPTSKESLHLVQSAKYASCSIFMPADVYRLYSVDGSEQEYHNADLDATHMYRSSKSSRSP